MASKHIRSFGTPDELIELETYRSEVVTLGGLAVSRETAFPGWRWSTHIRPIVGGDWCQLRHIGLLLRGHMGFRLQDGTEFEAGPFELFDIPPGHDGWVVGDEPVETIAWAGVRGFVEPLETLSERVVATMVFTDVVDSTGVAIRLGDRVFAELITTLETRTREVVGRYHGRLIKTTGDGILATFDGVARALRCAVGLRSTAQDLGLAIRVAVHTGEIELADDDIRGLAVHEASRMLGIAGPGEILVSATATELSREAGLSLVDRGEHELRGISGARRLYAVAS